MKKNIVIASMLVSASLWAQNSNIEIDQSTISKTVKIQNIKHGKVFSNNVFVLKPTVNTTENSNKTLNTVVQYAFSNGNTFTSQSDILVKFNTENVNVKDIEQKYGLKLIRKMNSGDYLFKNIGNDTLDTVNALLQNEATNIQRITPDLSLNVKPM